MPVALVTGASRGLGAAIAAALGGAGWSLILDARNASMLRAAADGLADASVIAGDVTDPAHVRRLSEAVRDHGRLDLLVNNASHLGPSPQPGLADYPLDELRQVYETNLLAPLRIIQVTLPWLLAAEGMIVNVSSDAAVEAYEGWGGYGSSKAALDHLTRILGEEQPTLKVYAFDPGDMRTAMHQQAFPGEDISDRPEPESVVPRFLQLVEQRPPRGRYRAAEFASAGTGR